MQIVMASGNDHKILEISTLLNLANINIISQSKLGIESVEETGTSFVANATQKAEHAHKLCKQAVLADDSGIIVPALDGNPGIYSARFAGIGATDEQNNQKLLKSMANLTATARKAYFICVLVFICQDKKQPNKWQTKHIIKKWHGSILAKADGSTGFGYDPIFMPNGMNQSAANLSVIQKNKVSHRGQAIMELKELITQL